MTDATEHNRAEAARREHPRWWGRAADQLAAYFRPQSEVRDEDLVRMTAAARAAAAGQRLIARCRTPIA